MLKPTRNLRQRKGKDAFSVQPATEWSQMDKNSNTAKKAKKITATIAGM
jgi:hypothetical protein